MTIYPEKKKYLRWTEKYTFRPKLYKLDEILGVSK